MLQIVFDVVAVYFAALLWGAGLYELIVPKFLRIRGLWFLLAPGLGFVLLAIVDGYTIYASLRIGTSLYVCTILAVLATAAAIAMRARAEGSDATAAIRTFIRDRAVDCRAAVSVRGFLFLLLMSIVIAPTLRAGMPTTPYRIGIDQVGYAEASQYLAEGGTIETARADLLARLGIGDLRKAEAQNLKSLHFETYIDSEFLLKAFRWGFPGVVASLTLLTHSVHVYRLLFLLPCFSFALLLGLCYVMLRRSFRLPSSIASIGVAALAMNCNLLNVYYEGQFAQIFTAPYVVLMLLLFLEVRSLARGMGSRAAVSPEYVRSSVLFALLTSFMLATYNETIVLIAGVLYSILALDVVLTRRTSRAAIVFVAVSFVAGFLFVLPFSKQWITYTLANLQGLSHAGFWQPHWASLAEIAGFLNMYVTPGYLLLERSRANEVASLLLSVFLAAVVAVFLLGKREDRDGLDRSFWLAPFLIVGAAYYKMNYIDGILNYPYMKIYTVLLPFIWCCSFAAAYALANRVRLPSRAVQYALAAVVVVTGLSYVVQYLKEGQYVTGDMFALYSGSHSRRFDGIALFTARKDIPTFMLAPLVSMNWVNEDGTPKYVAASLSIPAAALVRTGDLTCVPCFRRRYARDLLYASNSMLVVDTHKKLRDLCSPAAVRYRVDVLGYDGRQEWSGLPAPECDYDFALRLPFVKPIQPPES